jgi:molybdopterin/thiamine biosynthesis adenylyltransferase
MTRIFSKSPKPKAYRAETIETRHPDEHGVLDRQNRIVSWDQRKIARLKVLQIGAGGLGGETTEGLIRKGISQLHVCDADMVELSNLNRQKFTKEDLYRNKALMLAKKAVNWGTNGTLVVGYPFRIQEMVDMGIVPEHDIALTLVDHEETRTFASSHFQDVPLVFAGVGLQSERLYVFVQEPGKACYRCAIPEPGSLTEFPCQVPSCIDPAKVVGGLVLYIIDSLIMDRDRGYNYKEVNLSGSPPDRTEYIRKNPACPACGKSS